MKRLSLVFTLTVLAGAAIGILSRDRSPEDPAFTAFAAGPALAFDPLPDPG